MKSFGSHGLTRHKRNVCLASGYCSCSKERYGCMLFRRREIVVDEEEHESSISRLLTSAFLRWPLLWAAPAAHCRGTVQLLVHKPSLSLSLSLLPGSFDSFISLLLPLLSPYSFPRDLLSVLSSVPPPDFSPCTFHAHRHTHTHAHAGSCDEEPEREERVPSAAAGPVVFVNYHNDGSVSLCLFLNLKFAREGTSSIFCLPLFPFPLKKWIESCLQFLNN